MAPTEDQLEKFDTSPEEKLEGARQPSFLHLKITSNQALACCFGIMLLCIVILVLIVI